VERFKLASHRETKETTGLSIEVAKNGPKLRETTGNPLQAADLTNRRRNIDELMATLGPDGFPKAATWSPRAIEDGMSMFRTTIGLKVFFHAKTTHDLAAYLWEAMGSPV